VTADAAALTAVQQTLDFGSDVAQLPADQPARDRIASALDVTLFVEAGAGSGKTTALVERFVALVEAGVDADRIAAITFTEQAASELADRIRSSLSSLAAAGSERCAAALVVLDRAAICTLHAFAQRVLIEHPVEARLPPRFTVLDEIASDEVFDRRWDATLDALLDDPILEPALRVLLACRRKVDDLRELALQFRDNWDRLRHEPVETGPIEIDVSELCADLDVIVSYADRCMDDGDLLLAALERWRAFRDDLAAATTLDEIVTLLQAQPSRRRVGRALSWRGCDPGEVHDLIDTAIARAEALISGAADTALRRVGTHLANFTLEGAEERRREGTLEFHDLLVLARAVLRDPQHGADVRSAVAARYERLLLDEFQDTDPIQVELTLLIAADGADAGDRRWQEIEPRPGALFFVGDPKQSIYRFRRADIATFLAMRARVADGVERLTANFRSGRRIVEWVNRTFGELIVEQQDRQPAYIALEPRVEDAPVGPAVTLVGRAPLPPKTGADDVRAAEADAAAAAVRRVLDEAWSVRDDGGWRPARPRDICVLVPARTSLPFLERSLAAADVAYRAETSSLVYATGEVRDLMAVARAADDPTDQLALLTALRSAAFGCGDDDLYAWKRAGGRWDHQAPPAADLDGPVAAAMAWLAGLHAERSWLPPSAVLDRIVRERRLLEVAFAGPRPPDVLRRIRFVIDQARAWEDAGGGSLRAYLGWVQRQGAATSRVVETVLPETDEESVRIMTIHAAKGLEFPVVVASGLTSMPRARPSRAHVLWVDGRWEARLGSLVATADFEEARPVEEQMDAEERRRLLYVATTRARDHLLVSVHRVADRAGERTAAELLWDAAGAWTPDEGPPAVVAGVVGPAPSVPPPMPRPEWEAERAAAVLAAGRRLTVSATRWAEELASAHDPHASGDPGLAKDARDLELPAWQKGRYGTAVGRAVHAVLQGVDLASGAGLGALAAAQAAAEEVLGAEATIEALAAAALASDVVRDAATRPHWRELYVGAPVGATVVEGYIDLLVRTAEGLVVVDYKTDVVRDDAERAAKVARYRPQVAAYAAALEAAVGEPVVGAVLLFLAVGGAHEEAVPDLAGAVAEVRRA